MNFEDSDDSTISDQNPLRTMATLPYPHSNVKSTRCALKVLQLPVGVKQQRFWTEDKGSLADMEWRDKSQLNNLYDEFRWQRMFMKETEALVRMLVHAVH